jgi:outer membrane protein, heavy metal efflux system
MSLFRIAQLCALIIVLLSGCQSGRKVSAARQTFKPLQDEVPTELQSIPSDVSKVSFDEALPEAAPDAASLPPGELSLDWLVEEVQTRNPSLQAMVAAWRAAASRYPQAVSLDDPMFMTMAAPASFDSADVEAGYVFQGSQKFPWFGKRAARGRVARAESNAAFHDVEDNRVRLAEATRIAFYDYYIAHRQLELNRQNLEIVRQLRSTAQSRYQANQVTQQDVLQADVELAGLERRSLELERANRIAIARVNTLLREEPFRPLPPPPATLAVPDSSPDVEALQEIAVSQRPDLQALSARVRAEQASVTLATKDYYPDVEVFGRYDSFWQPAETQSDLRGQVGVNMNVPIYRGKLNAAVREALANLSQRRAEYEQRLLDVRYEVAAAYEELEESRQALELYASKLIPAAEQNVAVARSNYDVNKTTFLDLAVAQRQLIELREKREEALATYHTRQAELTRAVGGSEVAAQGVISAR